MKKIECYLRQEDCEIAIKALATRRVSGVVMTSLAGVGVERVPYPAMQSWECVSAIVPAEQAQEIAEAVSAAVEGHGGGGRIVMSAVDSLSIIGATAKVAVT